MPAITALSPSIPAVDVPIEVDAPATGFALSSGLRRLLWWVLGVALLARLLAMALVPLTDTTEARYAEIARKMLETGNWVTPQHDYGIPFWAKPPLSTWLSAGSMDLFGVNAFAARLPHLLLSLAILAMVWHLGRRRHNRDFGLLGAALLFSFPLFYLAAGAVMTDAALAFSACLCFMAFWLAITEEHDRRGRLWGYVFFTGLGLGLLAKGPICGLMTLPPILFWMLAGGTDGHSLWRRLPWVRGPVLMLLIAAPWYLWAEHRTPGFIRYFILGEHIERFLVPGWQGDLYGHAHTAPIGTIWLFWVLAVLPWALVAAFWLLSPLTNLKSLFRRRDTWLLYLFCWAVWPMLFFTLARNIIWPYVITGLLVAEIWRRGAPGGRLRYRRGLWLPFTLAALMLSGILAAEMLLGMDQPWARQTQKFLVAEYLDRRPAPDSQLYYLFSRYASAEFYSGGRAKHSDDAGIVGALLNNGTQDFVAIRESALGKAPPELFTGFRRVKTAFGVALFMESARGSRE